jgi:hypothetical protein
MAAKTEKSNFPAETLSLYDKLIATNPAIERKGAAIPYTSCNGHMFSQLTDDGSLALRLPPNEMEAFLKKYKTGHHVAYGIVRKEYALVPGELFKKTRELKKYFDMSYDYVKAMKPKPSKKTN